MGKQSGVSRGIGSSQHLHNGRFYSNGIQGGIVPLAAGFALAEKMAGTTNIAVAFIGDGTLGEGVVYESMNMAGLWQLPLLIVCEDNGYAQSTPKHLALSGSACARAKAFGIDAFEGCTDDAEALFEDARHVIAHVRQGKPAFFHVRTYRLAAHSKGDDDRDPGEVLARRETDPLNLLLLAAGEEGRSLDDAVRSAVDVAVARSSLEEELLPSDYLPVCEADAAVCWRPVEAIDRRVVDLINEWFHGVMMRDPKVVFMGEDVLSPYGGAFKVARGLSEKYPSRVLTTPISEAGIVGVANGLALSGLRPFVEVMFGDFITLCIDQLVNHAAKFRRMYGKEVRCPLVVRTPMGGRRGYGPTHSQTLDKLLTAIDDITVIATNALCDPGIIYDGVYAEASHPVVIIENKSDYVRKVASNIPRGYCLEASDEQYPTVRLRPSEMKPTLTLVAYGGAASLAVDSLRKLFVELEECAELIVPSCLSPLNLRSITESALATQSLLVVEEGSAHGGFGAEVIAQVLEKCSGGIKVGRVAAVRVPIPSVRSLEDKVLPQVDDIVEAVARMRDT
jgi:2-oxoisovalerate dehydrogenase E1 component